MKHRLKTLKRLTLWSIAATILACLLYLITPVPESLLTTHYSTIVTTLDDELLDASIARDQQWRFPSDAPPPRYITALLAFEDKRFYQHPGIDPIAIARAAVLNIKHGRIVSGGSTITMQLARLLRKNQARTFYQKAIEALLALKLEFHYSKSEIIALYAERIPLGGNTVGISAASWRYFGHKLNNLSWAEAALLSVLPNSPSALHLGRNRPALLAKRNTLLDHLAQQGHLSELELKLAKLESLPADAKPVPKLAPHLLATLQQAHPEQSHFRTYVRPDLQQQLLTLSDRYNKEYESQNIHNLAIVVLDNSTQTVIAYIGNQTRSSNIDYAPAVDIAQRPRSSGSLFKPFLFAQMIQQGQILPESLIPDIPSYYNGYNPKNYDRSYRGLVSAKEALTQSLNVPAVRMLQQYSVSLFKEDLQRQGLTTLWRNAEDYGLSLILGGAETTLWEITNSFSRMALSAQGITESTERARFFEGQATSNALYPIKQGAAWLTLKTLLEVNRPGIRKNWQSFSSSQKIAWKTGTSYGWHDAWAVGSNGRYTVGVWAGNANNEEARQLSGTQTAAPLMFDTFNQLESANIFATEPRLALKTYDVCRNDGYLPANGCETTSVYAPLEADFTTTTTRHTRINLDARTLQRVHGQCESPRNMRAKTYFTPTAVQAHYYGLNNTRLEPLPPWRKDCEQNLPALTGLAPFALEYPAEGARVKIPTELDGKLGRLILKAQHTNDQATLHWHLNDQYLASTRHIHEQAIAVNPGWHLITLVDDKGYELKQWFKAI